MLTNVINIKDALKAALKDIENCAGNQDLDGYSTGYQRLNVVTRGLVPGRLYTISSLPLMGKTSLVVSLMGKLVLEEKIPVALFSLGVGSAQIVKQIIANLTAVDYIHLQRGKLNSNEWRIIDGAIEQISKMPIYFEEDSLDVYEIVDSIGQLASEKKIKVVFIDGLQRISVGGEWGNDRSFYNAILTSLSEASRRFGVAIVLTSQLKQYDEEEHDTLMLPVLRDLNGYGDIAKIADQVWLLHRPSYYHIFKDQYGNDISDVAIISVAKNKFGPEGDVFLKYDSLTCHFEAPNGYSLAPEETHADEPSHSLPKSIYIKDGFNLEWNTLRDGYEDVEEILIEKNFDLDDDCGPHFEGCRNLERFEVLSDESDFFTVDGVLLMKLNDTSRRRNIVDRILVFSEMKVMGDVLVSVPAKYPNTTYEVPEGVSVISPNALFGTDIEHLVLSDSIEYIDGYGLKGMYNLKSITIPRKPFTVMYDGNDIPGVEIIWKGDDSIDIPDSQGKTAIENLTKVDVETF